MQISTTIEGTVDVVPEQRYAVIIVENDLAKLYVDTGEALSELLEIVTTWDHGDDSHVHSMTEIGSDVEATRFV